MFLANLVSFLRHDPFVHFMNEHNLGLTDAKAQKKEQLDISFV